MPPPQEKEKEKELLKRDVGPCRAAAEEEEAMRGEVLVHTAESCVEGAWMPARPVHPFLPLTAGSCAVASQSWPARARGCLCSRKFAEMFSRKKRPREQRRLCG